MDPSVHFLLVDFGEGSCCSYSCSFERKMTRVPVLEPENEGNFISYIVLVDPIKGIPLLRFQVEIGTSVRHSSKVNCITKNIEKLVRRLLKCSLGFLYIHISGGQNSLHFTLNKLARVVGVPVFLRRDLFSQKKCSDQKTYLAKVLECPKTQEQTPFQTPSAILGPPGGHFDFCRRCGVACGERLPPSLLGWY